VNGLEHEDALAIGRLIDEYADAVSRGDVDAFGRSWTPDGRWTGPGLECEGIDAITSAFAKLRGRITSADQEVVEGDVVVEGGGATGTWEIRETIVDRDGSERARVGRYDDEYRRTPDGWKFARRSFTPLAEWCVSQPSIDG
jgi:uncharacterized protein (TIGR02246 family)